MAKCTANTNAAWRLVSGPGDCHNADFTLGSNGVLRAAVTFDHETQPGRYVRVRAADTNSLWAEQYFAVVVTNIVTDDDDGDGHTEEQETLAGTDPLDANSARRFIGFTSSGTISWRHGCPCPPKGMSFRAQRMSLAGTATCLARKRMRPEIS